MAQPALDRFVRRGLAMKQEVTEGTDVTPTALADGIMLLNGQSGTEFDKVERNVDRAFFTGNPFGVANRRAFIEGDWELIPPATPGAVATSNAPGDILLFTAGFTVVKTLGTKTSRYNPISSSIPSASAYWWHVDTHKKCLGSRTSITGLRIAIGERAMARVRVQGSYTSITTDALPAITLPVSVPVIAQYNNSECNIKVNGGSDILVWAKELSIDLGNELTTKEYTSFKSTSINNRQPTFTLRVARAALADWNPWTIRDNATLFEARIRTYVANPGLYTEIGVRGQIENINEVDIDGDLGWEITGVCIASNTGGDELYVLFGDNTP